MNDAAGRGYGCFAVGVAITLAAVFGGWRLALTVGLVWLGGTMLLGGRGGSSGTVSGADRVASASGLP